MHVGTSVKRLLLIELSWEDNTMALTGAVDIKTSKVEALTPNRFYVRNNRMKQ